MYVELGKIVGVWGVKGWIKLHSYTRNRADIADYTRWYLSKHKKGPAFDNQTISVEVLHCREQAKGIVAQLEAVQDRDKAAELMGQRIWVKQSDLPELPEGEYYWKELIGLNVFFGSEELGKVVSIIETGANDVLVCKPITSGKPEILIPYTKEVVSSVNLEQGSMLVDWDPQYLAD